MSEQSSTAHLTSQSTLTPAINAWSVYLADQGNSPHTIKAFIHDLELLAGFLSPTHPLGNITTTDLNRFLSWMENNRGIPCSPKTLSRRITALKSFFRWLHQYAVISYNPAEKLIQQTVFSPLPTILFPDEVIQALDICLKYRSSNPPDARYYTLFYLLIATGLKKNECLNLSKNHIDESSLDQPVLYIRYNNPQYRYKERKINLPPDWIEVYHEYCDQYSIVDAVFPWSQRRLEYLLEDLSIESALKKHISFDMCRWTCAIQDVLAGMEKDQIRQKLGLSKVQFREVNMKIDQLLDEIKS